MQYLSRIPAIHPALPVSSLHEIQLQRLDTPDESLHRSSSHLPSGDLPDGRARSASGGAPAFGGIATPGNYHTRDVPTSGGAVPDDLRGARAAQDSARP